VLARQNAGNALGRVTQDRTPHIDKMPHARKLQSSLRVYRKGAGRQESG
jgi:hypothetical protein